MPVKYISLCLEYVEEQLVQRKVVPPLSGGILYLIFLGLAR